MTYSIWRDWAFWAYTIVSALLFAMFLIAVGPRSIWPWANLLIWSCCSTYLVLVLHVLPRSRHRSPVRTTS